MRNCLQNMSKVDGPQERVFRTPRLAVVGSPCRFLVDRTRNSDQSPREGHLTAILALRRMQTMHAVRGESKK
jgi:hypothetical protein